MKLRVAGTERVLRPSADGAEGVVLCMNPERHELEGAVHDALCEVLGAEAELQRTKPFRWVLLAHQSGERFERSCQRVIDTISALGVDVELLELDHGDGGAFRKPGRPAGV